MTSQVQRFCPACDRAFLEGEPVLRCPECDLMQHPNCWISNDGCLTEGHEGVSPVAEGYERRVPASATRSEPPPPVAAPAPEEPEETDEPVPPAPAAPSGRMIGSSTAPPRTMPMHPPRAADHPQYPSPPMVPGPPPRGPRAAPPVQQGRKRPNAGELGKPSPGMPRIYDRRGILRFWYIPVGILLAVGVAFGVMWGIDRFTGDDDPTPAGSETPTGSSTPGASETAGAGSGTPTAPTDATTTATAPAGTSSFTVGQTVLIQGTGQCLNIRAEAGLEAQAVDCLADGTQLELLEGPVVADELNWWRVQGPASTGWAADLYFAAQ